MAAEKGPGPVPGRGRARRGQAPTDCICPQCGYEVQKTLEFPAVQ